mmetsp:Transcript_22857/g.65964  ORF Transcript_22857/g.65964 Transcript_22857/m.65964 type:complete len:302 (-) Transcript_22857:550-1455(-)
MPASMSILRISSRARPSIRLDSTLALLYMRLDTNFFSAALMAFVIPGPYSSSVYCFFISSIQYRYMAPPGLLSASRSFLLPRSSIEASTRSVISALTASCNPSIGGGMVSNFFVLPTVSRKASSPSQIVPITEWPKETASIMVASGKKLAAPSIISTASLLPATIKFNSLTAICAFVGLTIRVSLIIPTWTVATAFISGTSEIYMAALAAQAPSASRPRSPSYESTQFSSCVSCFHPSQMRGRSGRSMMRDTRISCSCGRPSRLLNPPDVMPADENRSWYSTERGAKSIMLLGSASRAHVA